MLRSSWRCLALIAIAASPAAAQLWAPPYANGVGSPRTTRACSSDSFTLEVPLWRGAMPASFPANFAARLAIQPGWFGCKTCPASNYRVRLTPVLADLRSVAGVIPERLDGHLRSYVLRFERNKGTVLSPAWVTKSIDPSASCSVIKALRLAGTSALGLTEITEGFSLQPRFLVSRSCDVLAQDSEAFLGSAAHWAKERIEGQPTAMLPPVSVALIDTGVPVQLRQNLGVSVVEAALPSFEPWSGEYHPHASHMAALIHELAPHAVIHSYRALGGGGVGSVSSVAQATDAALFSFEVNKQPRASLVVNMSIGAPSDFFSPAELEGPNLCSTWEDGTGETLRYVLSLAERLDTQGPAVFIAAAGGNAPLERATTSQAPWAHRGTRTQCGTSVQPARLTSFLPAGFGEWASCRAAGTGWLPVLPVGASTFDDRRSVLTQRDAEPWLYAPGERVYASAPGMTSPPRDITCGTDVALEKGFEMPATVSGTSAATALVSAAAAHLLGVNPDGPLNKGWHMADLARLLFLTGAPLCDEGVRVGRNRLSIGRAQHALTHCESLLSCLRSPYHPVDGAVGGWTAFVCNSQVNDCLGVPSCGPNPEEPTWSPEYVASITNAPSACTTPVPRGPLPTSPDAIFPRTQLAGIGPQPSGSGCPNCSLRVGPGDELWLQYEISDAFRTDTRFENALVVLTDADKRIKSYLVLSATDVSAWSPGMVGESRVIFFSPGSPSPDALAADLRADKLSATLDLRMEIDGDAARTLDPLRVTIAR